MRKAICLLVIIFFLVPNIASADFVLEEDVVLQERGYAGGNLAFGTYDGDVAPDNASIAALMGKFGVHINQYFSAESRFGGGIADDTIDENGEEVDVKLDYLLGIYGRGHYPIGSIHSIYGVLGVTRGEITGTATETDTGFSFGAGADFYIDDQIGFNIEYIQYLNESDNEIDAFSTGFIFLF